MGNYAMGVKDKITPFTFINDISYNKYNIYDENNGDGNYVPFIANKYFSLFIDTILLANDLNANHHIDYKLQYDFLLNTVRKRRRHADWLKKLRNEDIDLIMNHYGFNETRAKEALQLLTPDQVEKIRSSGDTGGVIKK